MAVISTAGSFLRNTRLGMTFLRRLLRDHEWSGARFFPSNPPIGIGLQSPRGSGTSGYIQTNKFFVCPRSSGGRPDSSSMPPPADHDSIKMANKEILEHDRKRQIQLKLLLLQETLADQGNTDDEISGKLHEARKALEEETRSQSLSSSRAHDQGNKRGTYNDEHWSRADPIFKR